MLRNTILKIIYNDIMNSGQRKKNYIIKAISVFKQDGLRLSLEEVAGKMGITKKTLYNHFSSKDELLRECILSISSDMQQAVRGLDDPDHPAIENLRYSFLNLNLFFTELSPVFFYDIMRLNPNQATREHFTGSELFRKKLEANLRQGIKEGVYRKNLDVEFISRYISYSVFGFYINSVINNNPHIPKSYFKDTAEYNLGAIVSEKGKQLL
ncbi:MAG TPA: TetR/AcrR family transcriptional regulator [Bacteroidales bacterium]|nr:TetR/AcrR family transcriptional regulator [Bacteroidales bacterium]HOS72168.1 TetR/AcrR family transcriptional regulator [Bacteroidales bacterium]HQH25005.1 TetR/AcrR family transcriptional regulator [Bacteroidales bacterium]HQJ83060.1 TetR/AcrR family transcriptional regulator [Bacteroidales bacterium]